MEIPAGAYLKDISAHYNQLTLPRHFLAGHALPAETWGSLVVETGEVELSLPGSEPSQRVTPGGPAVIPPQTRFRLEVKSKGAQFFLKIYHEAKLADAVELAGLMGRGASRRSSRRSSRG